MRNRSAARAANRCVFALIAVITILLVVAVSYAMQQNKKVTDASQEGGVVAISSEEKEMLALANDVYETDTDGDGLMDWEEILWGTDKEKKDTDGDGINDKDEVYKNSNSEEFNFDVTSGSALRDINGKEVKSSEATNEVLNSTDAVARQLFGTYMLSIQKGNVSISEEEQLQMVEEALKAADDYTTGPKYTIYDVNTVPATQATRERYAVELPENMYAFIDDNINEYASLIAMMQGADEVGREVFLETIAQYKEATKTLANMRVPSDATSIHMRLVQNVYQYIHTIEGFAELKSDPLRAATSVKMFPLVNTELRASYFEVFNYVKKYGYDKVTF